MNTETASLDHLHDLVVPASTPWWPPAPGWYWVLGIVAVILVIALVRGFHRWQHDRYRREALSELARFERLVKLPEKRDDALLGMAGLLKRTAITAFGRVDVAQLSGTEWLEFLDRTGGTAFSTGKGTLFEQAVYQPDTFSLSDENAREIIAEIRLWVRGHQPC